MNVTKKEISPVSCRLTVEVTENDYKDKVEKQLKEIGRTRSIPGFRKGHVPAGELKRRFGRAVTSDVINHEVYEAVIKFIEDNKLRVLGEPMPVEVKAIEPDQPDYTFEYDLALAPEVDVKLDKSVKVPYYVIKVTDEMVDEQDKQFRKRFGAQVPGEEFEEDALVKGTIMELDEDGKVKETEDAIQVINGIVLPMHFADRDQAAKFNGAKVGSKVVFNPAKAAGDNVVELASMLNIDRDRAAQVTADFEMAVSEIIVVKPAEHDEEFYTNVFGKDRVHDEKEYMATVKAMITEQLRPNSEEMFERDVTNYLLEKYGDMELPVELLKKWLARGEEAPEADKIDDEFKRMENSLKWQLIRDRVGAITQVKVEENDLLAFARIMARQQFAQYGMTNVDDETLTDYAKRILADRNYRRNIIDRVADRKLFDAIKNHIDAEVKEVSLDEFKELASK